MSYSVGMQITGLDDLLSKLGEMRSARARRIRRDALNVAATPLLQMARQLVPVDSGLLKRSLGKRAKTYASSGTVVVVIGPRSGFKQEVFSPKYGTQYRNPTKYAHLVEKGTVHSRGSHFMEQAVDATREQVATTLAQKLSEGIERELAR